MQTDATASPIRRATAHDADALSTFGRRAFSETFAGDNTPADLEKYLNSAFSPQIQRAELEQAGLTCLMMERDGAVLAYAMIQTGANSPHVSDPTAAELRRFYVDRTAHGTGVAQTLMDSCIASAAESGANTVFLGVWERNLRAIRFYEKQGFTKVGKQVFTLGDDVQQDRVMARLLP